MEALKVLMTCDNCSLQETVGTTKEEIEADTVRPPGWLILNVSANVGANQIGVDKQFHNQDCVNEYLEGDFQGELTQVFT